MCIFISFLVVLQLRLFMFSLIGSYNKALQHLFQETNRTFVPILMSSSSDLICSTNITEIGVFCIDTSCRRICFDHANKSLFRIHRIPVFYVASKTITKQIHVMQFIPKKTKTKTPVSFQPVLNLKEDIFQNTATQVLLQAQVDKFSNVLKLLHIVFCNRTSTTALVPREPPVPV